MKFKDVNWGLIIAFGIGIAFLVLGAMAITGCTQHIEKKIIVNVKQVDVDIRLELKGD